MFLIVLSLVIVSMFIVGCGTGEAVKVGKVAKEAPALKESVKVLEFVDFGKLSKFYSPTPGWELSKTGTQICKEMGYSGCEASSITRTRMVYSSSNKSCSVIAYEDSDTQLVACDAWSKEDEGCVNDGGQDHGTSSSIRGVFCTK